VFFKLLISQNASKINQDQQKSSKHKFQLCIKVGKYVINLLEPFNNANLIKNLKLNHIINDRGSIYICDMYVCLCAFAWLYIWNIGILYAKAFSGFSMNLSSSIQLEDVGFINSGGDCLHKQV